MATTRIKDLSKTATTVNSDANLVLDGNTGGTQKITRDNFRQDTADAFVAAPGTYNLAPLNSGTGKIDATYLPTSSDTPKGAWDASSNTPTLADGSGTAGDYYDVTVAGSYNLGSGSIAFTVGDVVKYNGTVWYKIDSVANFLDGYSTAATSRAALSVNSIDEDAEATATKLVGPSLYFTTNDYIEFSDDGRWSFTDGADDLPMSIVAKLKFPTKAATRGIIAKFGSAAPNMEWALYLDSSDRVNFSLRDASGNFNGVYTTAGLSAYSDKPVHVAVTYGGSGPNSASAFSNAHTEMNIYINNVAVATTQNASGSYAGMSNSAQAVWVGRRSTDYFDGHIFDAKVFNRELTATEVAQLARGVDLGFADEWGGANGGVYTQDSTPSGEFAAVNTVLGDHAGPLGGKSNVLSITVSGTASSAKQANLTIAGITGKRIRVKGFVYVPSTNSNADGFILYEGGVATYESLTAPTQDTWVPFEGEAIYQGGALRFAMQDGGATTFADSGGDDVIYIAETTVTEIGTLADLRAENFDESTGKLYDESSNAFVGVNSGATLTGRALPVYKTGTWVPSLYYSGTSAATYSAQSGYYTRIGNTVYVRGSITVSGIGASSGAVSVVGLPFTPSSDGASSSVAECYMTSAANLTSQPIGLVGDGVSQISLYDSGATGNTALDETNITASSVIKISATYQIQ